MERDAARALDQLGYEPVTDPLTELLNLTGRALALERFFAHKVAAVEDEMRYSSDAGLEQLRAEVGLWERAQHRCGRFLEAIVRLDIEDRLVKIKDRQADVVAQTIEAVLAELGVARSPQVRSSPGRHRRAIEERPPTPREEHRPRA